METISIQEAAKLSRVWPSQIYASINHGSLVARLVNGRLEVERASLESWARRLRAKRELRREELLPV